MYEGVDEGVGEGVHEGVKVQLSREIVYQNLRTEIDQTQEIEQLFTVSTATAERDIALLKERGLLVS
jgi:ATP-dependent DNA helicase RecG